MVVVYFIVIFLPHSNKTKTQLEDESNRNVLNIDVAFSKYL